MIFQNENNILYQVLSELETHHHSKEDLMVQFVQERLNSSFKNYANDINIAELYLSYRNDARLLSSYKKVIG